MKRSGLWIVAVFCIIPISSGLRAAQGEPDAAAKVYSLQNKFGIAVAINATQGEYLTTYKGRSWLGPGIVSVLAKSRWYRSADLKFPEPAAFHPPQGRLLLLDASSSSGTDRLGTFDSVNLTWKVPAVEVKLVTSFRLYRDAPYLVFGQEFPGGFKNYASGNWIVPSVVFPQFITAREARQDLYSWVSGGMFSHRFGYGPASNVGGTVDLLLLANQDYDTMLLSPLANYLVATQQSAPVASQDETEPAKAAINCGIEGLVEEIPAGYKHEHLLVAGKGIDRTFREWGHALLTKAGKQIPSKYEGDTMKYPVYWDDYGAYYREHGFKEDGYKSYEDIIIGIAKDAKEHGLRIGAYEVTDSDQILYDKGLFEPRKDLFPHGLAWLHDQIGAPLEAYLCWLAPNGPYRKKYPYWESPKGNVLGGTMGDVFYSIEYWRDTAARMVSWGAILLQHDYQSVYEGDPVMMSGINRMDTYFKNMAKALGEKGIKMQYCMQYPRNIMESTENPTMIGVQGSWDHHVPMSEPKPTHQDDDLYVWKHLTFASAFYGALGIWPSRDNIQTLADPNAFEDVLLANLIGGEIQLGHRIGECDFELVKKTYRGGDELVLKPDRPLVPLDRCYLEGCAAGFTESDHNGKQWFYVVNFPPSARLHGLSVSDLGVGGRWAVYNFDTRAASLLEATTALSLHPTAKHEYFVLAPLFANGMTVIGDTSKFITMADMRIASVGVEGNALRVGVTASEAESPVITGYATAAPAGVDTESAPLEETSSVDTLQAAKSGWYWDDQTKLWYVKLDFAGAKEMTTKSFSIQP
jgi:hypothetical protein